MVRAFIALELSDEIKDQLTAAQQTLRGCRARLTFVEPKNIHITAKFLGDVDEKNLPKVIEALKKITFIPFPVTAGKVTVNNPKRPHTVWCAIDDAGEGGKVFQADRGCTCTARVRTGDPQVHPPCDHCTGQIPGLLSLFRAQRPGQDRLRHLHDPWYGT